MVGDLTMQYTVDKMACVKANSIIWFGHSSKNTKKSNKLILNSVGIFRVVR